MRTFYKVNQKYLSTFGCESVRAIGPLQRFPVFSKCFFPFIRGKQLQEKTFGARGRPGLEELVTPYRKRWGRGRLQEKSTVIITFFPFLSPYFQNKKYLEIDCPVGLSTLLSAREDLVTTLLSPPLL